MNEAWTRTSRDRWTATRDSLIEKLAQLHPGDDVTVFIGSMPCGFFIWDEAAKRHAHIKPADVMWALGDKIRLDRVQL